MPPPPPRATEPPPLPPLVDVPPVSGCTGSTSQDLMDVNCMHRMLRTVGDQILPSDHTVVSKSHSTAAPTAAEVDVARYSKLLSDLNQLRHHNEEIEKDVSEALNLSDIGGVDTPSGGIQLYTTPAETVRYFETLGRDLGRRMRSVERTLPVLRNVSRTQQQRLRRGRSTGGEGMESEEFEDGDSIDGAERELRDELRNHCKAQTALRMRLSEAVSETDKQIRDASAVRYEQSTVQH
eukprot:GHVQ01039949.1.p1 GENE.GHVQ01039949.1~~GHVQ01039949.1.p1  ORF type:complete len:247 (-),score=68.50 GHVQ01039949.1:1937-2647(-)